MIRLPARLLASAAQGNTKTPPAARWLSEEDNHKGRFGEPWVTWSDMNPGAQKVDLAISSVLQNPAPETLILRP